MIAIYIIAIVLYAVLFAVVKCLKKSGKEDDQTAAYGRLKLLQHAFKYYLIAALLALSGNMLFSCLLTLYAANISSAAAAINVVLAVLVLVAYVTFLVFYFSWSRKMRIGYIHPDGHSSN